MAKVISFANQKGGVGKSTICIQQSLLSVDEKKKKVLVVDMDGQGNTSSRLAAKRELEDGEFEPVFRARRQQSCLPMRSRTSKSCTVHAGRTSFTLQRMTRICLRWRRCLWIKL